MYLLGKCLTKLRQWARVLMASALTEDHWSRRWYTCKGESGRTLAPLSFVGCQQVCSHAKTSTSWKPFSTNYVEMHTCSICQQQTKISRNSTLGKQQIPAQYCISTARISRVASKVWYLGLGMRYEAGICTVVSSMKRTFN